MPVVQKAAKTVTKLVVQVVIQVELKKFTFWSYKAIINRMRYSNSYVSVRKSTFLKPDN